MLNQTSPNAVVAVCEALGAFLKTQIPELNTVTIQWPEPNEQLVYPAIGIYVKVPKFTPAMPYVIARGNPDPVTHLALVTKVMGYWDFSLQVDCWGDYKATRDALLQRVFEAFSLNFDVPGVSLNLTEYFNESCHFSLDTNPYMLDASAAERGEWRATLTVLANMRALTQQNVALVTTIENNLQTPETIPAPAPAPSSASDSDLIL